MLDLFIFGISTIFFMIYTHKIVEISKEILKERFDLSDYKFDFSDYKVVIAYTIGIGIWVFMVWLWFFVFDIYIDFYQNMVLPEFFQ